MKKLIALLLALLMVSSTVIAVSAEEEPLTAPKVFAQTEPVIDKGEDEESTEDDTIVGYNVRFLAGVYNTTGTEIGFTKVVAKFYDTTTKAEKTVEYTSEQYPVMKGNTLYSKVMIEGVPQSVADATKDDKLIGLFPAGINSIPVDLLNVSFEIEAYVTDGTDTKSTTVTAEYLKGEIANISYSEDFTTEKSSTEILAEAGITNPYNSTMPLTIEDKKLNILNTYWKNGNTFFGLVDREYFAKALADNNNQEFDYTISMKLDIKKLHVFTMIFNGTPDSNADTTYKRANSMFVSLRLMSANDTAKSNGDLISNVSSADTYNIWLRHGGWTDKNVDVLTFETDTSKLSSKGYADVEACDIPTGATNVELELTVVVNNTYENGCQVEVFVGNTSVYSFVAPEAYDMNANSYITVFDQLSVMSIDDVKVNKVNSAITLGSIPTDVDEIYFENFDDVADTSALLNECGISTANYIAEKNCISGLPMNINDNDQLQIIYHEYHTNPDYFADVVPAGEINGAELYKFEADVSITSVANFGFTLNNKHLSTNSGAYKYLSNYLFVKFVVSNNNLTGLQVVEANAAGGTGDVTKTTHSLASTVSAKDGFKFSVIVDSTDENACVLYLFINDELVAVHTTASNAWDVADATDVSTIGIFAEKTEATIDNIKVTGVKKNS